MKQILKLTFAVALLLTAVSLTKLFLTVPGSGISERVGYVLGAKKKAPKKPTKSAATVTSKFFGIPCHSNPNLIFDQALVAPDDVSTIVPPGAIASEEIKPHSYIDLNPEKERVAVYAPADMELVQGAYYSEPPTFTVPTVYIFHFQLSCEMALLLDHISDPVEKIKALFPATPRADTRMESILPAPRLKLKKGELVGYARGAGNASAHIRRFDFGLFHSGHTNNFVNQSRYTRSNTWKAIHAVCAYDYFTADLKQRYYAKFATLDRRPVSGAPCRVPNHDKAGTLAGAWFFSQDGPATEPHVAIGLELDQATVIIAGLPRQADPSSRQGNQLSIDKSSPTFLDPAEVTSEHCYYDLHSKKALYFKLHSSTKAEVYQGINVAGCPDTLPASQTSFIYR